MTLFCSENDSVDLKVFKNSSNFFTPICLQTCEKHALFGNPEIVADCMPTKISLVLYFQ